MCTQRSDAEQHAGHDGQDAVGVSPTVVVDQPFDDRDEHEGSGADPGHRQTEGDRASLLEPATDGRDRRYVAAGHADADAQAVSEVAELDRLHLGGEEQSCHHRDGSDDHDSARADPICEAAGDDADRKVGERRDREEERGLGPVGAELVGHRAEELAEAVGDPEDGEHRDERGRNDHPSPRGVERSGCRCHQALSAA